MKKDKILQLNNEITNKQYECIEKLLLEASKENPLMIRIGPRWYLFEGKMEEIFDPYHEQPVEMPRIRELGNITLDMICEIKTMPSFSIYHVEKK